MTSMNDPETTAETETRRAADERAERQTVREEERTGEKRGDEERSLEERESAATPGAPGNDEPMSESTDGGLSGGDPGVEE